MNVQSGENHIFMNIQSDKNYIFMNVQSGENYIFMNVQLGDNHIFMNESGAQGALHGVSTDELSHFLGIPNKWLPLPTCKT